MGHPETEIRRDAGYAIIGRFLHREADNSSPLLDTRRFELNPGEALLFTGTDDIRPEEPVRIGQERLCDLPGILGDRKLQLLMVLDREGRGLLVSDGSGSVGMDPVWPAEHRVSVGQYGRIFYVIILGKDQLEAETMLRELTEKRLHRH